MQSFGAVSGRMKWTVKLVGEAEPGVATIVSSHFIREWNYHAICE